MPDKVHTIAAGSTPAYEIVELENGVSILIRSVSSGGEIKFPRSMVPILVETLGRIPHVLSPDEAEGFVVRDPRLAN